MNSRLPYAARILLAAAALLPAASSAVVLTINDTCGSSLTGSITGSGNVAVGQAGNIIVSGFGAAPFSMGVGACEAAAPGDKPKCALIASPAQIEPGATVTFFSRCSTASPISGYAWSGPTAPALPSNSASLSSFSVTFPNSGVFSYAVSATNANGAGPASPPANVLVAPASSITTGPSCVVTLSPNSIVQNTTSNMKVSCQPEAASYAWDASETGAPPAAGGAGTLTFNAPGSFTYKVRGVNANGSPGPKASATVNVISDGSCVPGPYYTQIPLPQYSYSQDAALPPNNTIAWSFVVGSGAYSQIGFQYHTAYNYYPFPNSGVVAVSKCRGDFNVPAQCQGIVNLYWSGFYPANNSPYANGSYCVLEPNVTYYMNVKPTDCSNSPTGYCGFRMYRYQ